MNFIKIYLRGMGQIMLQNSALVGLFFLLGIFFHSHIMGLGAILGLVVGTISAVLFKYSEEEIKNGLYGFNGALVGIALTFFYKPTLLIFFAIIIFSILSTFLMHFMMKKNWKAFTLPFVASTWIAFLAMNFFNLIKTPEVISVWSDRFNLLSSTSMGFGQVMFQGSVITGIIFFLGILIHSKKSAGYGVLGSILGAGIGVLLGMPMSVINLGILGYNAVLCAIAFSNDNKYAFLSSLIAITLSVLILDAFTAFNFIALTAPFVLAVWITLFLKKKFVS